MDTLSSLTAAGRRDDFLRVAERSRVGGSEEIPENTPTIALRIAGADEAGVVRRLAALDDARPLRGQVLLAVVNGEPVAALSLQDGRVVANPLVLTELPVSLLRLHHRHLMGTARRRRRWRAILRPRFA